MEPNARPFPKSLLEATRYFADPDVCVEFVSQMRWPDGVVCPVVTCRGRKHSYLKSRRIWKCLTCKKQFSVKVGTVFEDSAIPLDKWLVAAWLIVNAKNGISSWELHRALKITQKAAWFVLHRLRYALKGFDLGFKIGSNDGGAVEVDETFVGGKLKNMHRDRRVRFAAESGHTGGATGKTPVLGMLDRQTREMRAMVVPNVKRDTLQAMILKNVKYGSKLYTDDAVAYDRMQLRYVHEVVNHAVEYVRGQVHTNGLENFWSLFKRGLRGTYVAVEPFHLERYVDEQVFRYNNRATEDNPLTDADRFRIALKQVAGKRLTYTELTGKNDATTPF